MTKETSFSCLWSKEEQKKGDGGRELVGGGKAMQVWNDGT
jgi:hypothetical protein